MAQFSDLLFGPHPSGLGERATFTFDNGYSVSVVSGDIFYTAPGQPYEMAVLHNGALVYDTPVTDDVLGYLTADDVTRHMAEVAALPARVSA